MQDFDLSSLAQDLKTKATQGQLILRTGLSKTVIQAVRNNRVNPKISTVVKLCKAINQPLTKYITNN